MMARCIDDDLDNRVASRTHSAAASAARGHMSRARTNAEETPKRRPTNHASRVNRASLGIEKRTRSTDAMFEYRSSASTRRARDRSSMNDDESCTFDLAIFARTAKGSERVKLPRARENDDRCSAGVAISLLSLSPSSSSAGQTRDERAKLIWICGAPGRILATRRALARLVAVRRDERSKMRRKAELRATLPLLLLRRVSYSLAVCLSLARARGYAASRSARLGSARLHSCFGISPNPCSLCLSYRSSFSPLSLSLFLSVSLQCIRLFFPVLYPSHCQAIVPLTFPFPVFKNSYDDDETTAATTRSANRALWRHGA